MKNERQHFKAVLNQVGLKASKPRLEIYRQLMKSECALSAQDLHSLVKKEGYDFSTVYRNLSAFVTSGLVQALYLGDGLTRYEIPKQGSLHHHHLICRKCKKVELVNQCFIPKRLSGPAFKGFKDLAHRLEFEGVCPSCS